MQEKCIHVAESALICIQSAEATAFYISIKVNIN